MIKAGQKYKYMDKIYEIENVSHTSDGLRVSFVGMSYSVFHEKDLDQMTLVAESIYLAHPISNTYEAEASIKTAQLLRDKGFEVYAAAENTSINDKLNNPTPRDIFKADCDKIKECDAFVVNITGGMQDGTLFEVGYAAALGKRIIAYSTNTRLVNPQHWNGIPSASANHLVLGAIDTWCNSLEEVLHELQS